MVTSTNAPELFGPASSEVWFCSDMVWLVMSTSSSPTKGTKATLNNKLAQTLSGVELNMMPLAYLIYTSILAKTSNFSRVLHDTPRCGQNVIEIKVDN